MELSLRLRAIELQLDEFANAGAFDGREAVVVNGVAHSDSLGVEHTLLGQHDDLDFHFLADYGRWAPVQARSLRGYDAWRRLPFVLVLVLEILRNKKLGQFFADFVILRRVNYYSTSIPTHSIFEDEEEGRGTRTIGTAFQAKAFL